VRKKTRTADGPRIYVADLAAYNAGVLRGAWIDAHQDAEQIQAEIATMLADSPEPGAEEWAIHDYEGFEGVKLGEHEDLEEVAQIAELLAQHGPLFGKVVDHFGRDYLEEAIRAMEESYAGEYDTLADWAEQFAEDTGSGDCGPYSNYIDWERVARDAELGGDIFTIETDDGKVHVFNSQ
jgi:antirestriction protein